MRKTFVFFVVLILATGCWAKELSFKATVDKLKPALLTADIPTLTKHIDLTGIVNNLLKKYYSKAQQKDSVVIRWAGKLVQVSQSLLTKTAVNFILDQYGKSSPAVRQSYVNSLKLTRFGSRGETAYATGSFMGQPATLAALKIKGDWVIVGVKSPIIDSEFKNLLRILKISF